MSKASIGSKVKSYWLDRFGIDNLTVEESEQENLKAGQVRVKMQSVSLNYRDLLMIKGLYDPKILASGGLIPLSDGAGIVVDIGTDVDRFKIGDRVAAIFMQDWLAGECNYQMTRSALGGAIDGLLTTHKIFNQNGLVHLPTALSYEEGATLPCAALTAWHALVQAGKLKAGDTVLIQGTGGVAIFALQFAKMSGAKVILISSDDQKLERAKQLGADFLINYKQTPDWEVKAREYTNGEGVDHVVEVGGAKTLAQSCKAVRMGGKVLIIGILSGAEGGISPIPVLMKNLCLQGIFVGSREMFESMNKAIQTNNLHPVIDRVFPFSDSKEAMHYLESGKHLGKVVIGID